MISIVASGAVPSENHRRSSEDPVSQSVNMEKPEDHYPTFDPSPIVGGRRVKNLSKDHYAS